MDNFVFTKDREVVFETATKVFIGKLFYIDKNRTHIVVRSVQDFKENRLISKGNMTFYNKEIQSIRYLSSASDSSETNSNENYADGSVIGGSKTNAPPLSQKSDTLHSANDSYLHVVDIERIKHQIAHSKYISRVDGAYSDALRDIRYQYEIGLNIEGEKYTHGRNVSLIVISTLTNIYLFDILSLGRYPEIIAIFLNERIEKIVHNSRRFTRLVKLVNVFDTMVAHAATDKIQRMLSIQECVADNFRLPNCFADVPQNLNFTDRPLNNKMRKIAAQNVAYLLILQKYLTRTMLRPFYESVKKFENKPTTLDETFQEIDVTGQTEKDELNELKKVNRFEMKVEINRIKE